MGFFVDRLVEFPGRIKLTDVSSGTEQVVDVTREEGNIIEEGTLLNASNLNYGTTLGEVQIDPTAPAGTTDGDLYAAIDGNGWTADVVSGGLLQVKETFLKLLSNFFFKRQYIAGGYVSVGSISANSYKDITVNYNMPNLPNISATLFSSGTTSNIGSVCVAVAARNATSATLRIFNDRSTSISPGIMWFAIYLGS